MKIKSYIFYTSVILSTIAGTLYAPDTLTKSLQEQKNVLDLSKRYDETCFLAAHNAFASKASGWWWYRQQNYSILQMLEHGVRGFMFDIYRAKNKNADAIYLCHGGCSPFFAPQKGIVATFKSLVGIRHYETLESVLALIREWLWATGHKNEIVTLFFENYVSDTLLNETLEPSLKRLIFTPAEFAENGNQWPTLQELITKKKRIICFNEKKGKYKEATPDTTYCFPTFDYIIESKFGFITSGKVCFQRKESAEKDSKDRSLLLFNYFSTPSIERDARKNNRYLSIFSALLSCHQQTAPGSDVPIPTNIRPNFIALDFVDQGEGLRVVETINKSDSIASLRNDATLKYIAKTTSQKTSEDPTQKRQQRMSIQFRTYKGVIDAYQWTKNILKKLSAKKVKNGPILPASKSSVD
jgi:hypothetical protein